jgi:polyhydroxybutyrate depolymerase
MKSYAIRFIHFSFFTFLSFLIIPGLPAQMTIMKTMVHDGLNRKYILYIPVEYNESEKWPLVINMHGFSSTAEVQMIVSEMSSVADTGDFLIVFPEGTPFISSSQTLPSGGLGWNNGSPGDTILYPEYPVDDVDFISHLIDSIDADYPLDLARVYATGLSNGAVMSNVLACELFDRIAAIAPVAGTGHPERPCTPLRGVPVLQIHGTADPITDYQNGTGNRIPVKDYLGFWLDINGCNTEPVITVLPNVVVGDNSTIELHTWGACAEEVIHYKVIDGGHIWPGDITFPSVLGNSNKDINASAEIWNFFNRNPHPQLTPTRKHVQDESLNHLKVYPNPFHEKVTVEIHLSGRLDVQLSLMNVFGQIIFETNQQEIPEGYSQIHLDLESADIPSGIYFLVLKTGNGFHLNSQVLYML